MCVSEASILLVHHNLYDLLEGQDMSTSQSILTSLLSETSTKVMTFVSNKFSLDKTEG